MISCTEFIFTYSELFKFIEKKGGKEEVIKYWEYISDTYIKDRLGELVKNNGIEGCYDYWSKSLSEEAADFTMTLDDDIFTIDMHYCPSKGRLIENQQIKAYPDYCEHCDLLYRRVLEPLGFKYDFDMSNTDKAQCSIIVRKLQEKDSYE